MHKVLNRMKSAVLGGIIAATSVAPAAFPSLSSNAASTDNYAKLLQYSLYFYDANMCGKHVEETTALTWRGNCHTGDSVDGGYHDAGDHVKFGLPAGYAASVLGLSYFQFGDAFDSTGTTAHLKTITDYFATFFKNSTTLSGSSVSKFVYQIGDGGADHAVWCAPEKQDQSSRKEFSTTSGASDIAAEYAASLAANYVNFGNEEDLTYAKALFDFSTKYNQKATEGVGGFYDSWDYYDDQAWAAGWLYLATKDNTYKSFLNTYMNTSDAGSSGMDGGKWGIYSTLSWNNVSMGAGILQAIITGDSSDWNKVTTYIDSKGGTSSNYYFESEWGSARYNTAQQTAALIASKNGAKDYYSWAKGQMDYILGNNPSGYNFVVGMESNSSKYPHHRAASGYNSNDEMTGQTGYASTGHTLVGALVGGPVNEGGSYTDTIQDYKANEVTLDYNATLVAAAAGLYSKYKTGSTVEVSSIPEVKASSAQPGTTKDNSTTTTTTERQGTPTTTTTASQTSPVTTTKGGSSSGKTETEADVYQSNGQYAFKPNGADSVEVTLKLAPNTNGNGCLGYDDNGNWTQIEYSYTSDGSGSAVISKDLGKASNANEIQVQLWWPSDGVTIDSVKLIYNSSAQNTSAATTTTVTVPTTATTVPSGSTLYGDANCDNKVNIADAVAILQYLANQSKYPLTAQGLINADCDAQSGITGNDAIIVQKVDAKLIDQSELPTNR